MSYEVRDFEKDVLQRSHAVPVLVDFWAEWCGPCKMLAPTLERMAAQASGRWELVKVNVDAHPELATAFGIQSIPNVKLFHKGKVVDEFVGVLSEAEIQRWLDAAIPSPHAATLDKARALLAEGAAAEAAQLLEPVVQVEPANHLARVLLAEACLHTDPARVPELLEGIGPDSDHADKAEALRTLSRLALLSDHPDELPEGPMRDRFLEGARHVKQGNYAEALESFIEVLERDRNYHDMGARDACKAIFQLLGIRHSIVERYFRAFSSALHA